jgi:hypothetical protein
MKGIKFRLTFKVTEDQYRSSKAHQRFLLSVLLLLIATPAGAGLLGSGADIARDSHTRFNVMFVHAVLYL